MALEAATVQIVPIIVVHAITASGLHDRYPPDAERVWSPWEFAKSDFDRITLYPHASQTPVFRYEAIEPALVRPSEVFGVLYKDLIAELKHNLSYPPTPVQPVYSFVYDWRQDNFLTMRQLREFVEEVIARSNLLPYDSKKVTGPLCECVDLVGHSMGGLVISGCIVDGSKDGWSKKRIRRVATLGTPFRGANAAITKLATGTGTLFGRDAKERERTMARVTPSVYQLLPSFDGCLDGKPAAAIWDPATYQESIVRTIAEHIGSVSADNALTKGTPAAKTRCRELAEELLTSMLDGARNYRALTDSVTPQMLRSDGQWLAVVGVGEKTLIGTGFDTDPEGDARFDFAAKYYSDDDWREGEWDTGDETVPLGGATPPWKDSWRNVVVVRRQDFGFWEMGDSGLQKAMGLHATLPLLNLAQRWLINFFRPEWSDSAKLKQHGELWGRTHPDWKPGEDPEKVWRALIPGLTLSSTP